MFYSFYLGGKIKTESDFHCFHCTVDNLADLCESVSEIQASVIDLVQDRCDLLAALLRGNPVLVPYDADKNHQPCQKRGHKAHWTVLTGKVSPPL